MKRNLCFLTFAVTIACAFLLPPVAWLQGLGQRETNTYLNGTNLTYYPRPSVGQCEADCAKNANCKGFTWIQAGTYNANDGAMCYLVSAVTGRVSARGHISAVKAAAPDRSGVLNGRWTNSGVVFYNLNQNGNNFTWTKENADEVGRGTIEGDDLKVSWTGGGAATGKIVQRDANGRPRRIDWSNGVVFTRVQ
jgi:hypothetical protein